MELGSVRKDLSSSSQIILASRNMQNKIREGLDWAFAFVRKLLRRWVGKYQCQARSEKAPHSKLSYACQVLLSLNLQRSKWYSIKFVDRAFLKESNPNLRSVNQILTQFHKEMLKQICSSLKGRMLQERAMASHILLNSVILDPTAGSPVHLKLNHHRKLWQGNLLSLCHNLKKQAKLRCLLSMMKKFRFNASKIWFHQ